jgi:hypothetical protein
VLLRRQANPTGRRLRRRWQALAGCAAVAVACAGCGQTDPPPPVGSVVSGPIQILVTAPSINSIGNPVGVTSFYRPDAHSVTAVAALGQLSGPQTMVITWSQLTAAGPKPLFSQHLTVTSYGRAYSTAVDSGAMAYGAYEVSATVAGVTRTIEWGVYKSAKATVGTSAKVAGPPDEAVEPLTPGTAAARPEPINRTRTCQWQDVIATMPTPQDLHIDVSAYCPQSRANGPTRGTVLATMGTPNGQRLVGMMHNEQGGLIVGNFRFNVCSLPFGSDVPGAHIAETTIVYYQGTTRSFTFTAGLPGSLLGPQVSISSSVPPGTPVHPGEKIKLRITTTESDRTGAQPGIRNVRVSGPSGLIKVKRYRKVVSGCGTSRADRVLNLTYVVPASAPNVIKILVSSSVFRGATTSSAITFPFAA